MATQLTRCPHGRWISDKLHCRECLGLGSPALYALMLDVQSGMELDQRYGSTHDGVLVVGAPRQRGRPEYPRPDTGGWLVKP